MRPNDSHLAYLLFILGIVVSHIVVFGIISYVDHCNAKANKNKETGNDDDA